jgi:hypothetical protein
MLFKSLFEFLFDILFESSQDVADKTPVANPTEAIDEYLMKSLREILFLFFIFSFFHFFLLKF